MAGRRTRPSSLHIPIPDAHQWRAPRPPTPRRSTYPQLGTTSADLLCAVDNDAPPVPPLSYWEPDTPEALTSPTSIYSPRSPFFSSPPHSPLSLNALFPTASPVLPASPLSIFDRILSPMTPTFLVPRPPPPPPSLPKGVCLVRRHSTTTSGSVLRVDLDKIQYDGVSEVLGAIRERVFMEMALKRQEAAVNESRKSDGAGLLNTKTNKSGETLLHTKTGMAPKEMKRLLSQRDFRVVKDAAVAA